MSSTENLSQYEFWDADVFFDFCDENNLDTDEFPWDYVSDDNVIMYTGGDVSSS